MSLKAYIDLNHGFAIEKNTLSGGAYASPLVTGLLAYFKLGNNGSGDVSLVDSTGNGYTVTNFGATLGSAPFGTSSGSAQCQGGPFGSYLDSTVEVPTNSSYSVSCWVRTTNFADTSHFLGDIFDNGFMFQSIDNAIYFYSSGLNALNPAISPPLSNNVWYHAVGTFSSGIASLFINGSVVDAVSNPPASGGASFGIGGNPNNEYTMEDGQLSEIGIWNRALSANEVLALYNAGSGLTYPFIN
jgi:hypothetical protein